MYKIIHRSDHAHIVLAVDFQKQILSKPKLLSLLNENSDAGIPLL